MRFWAANGLTNLGAGAEPAAEALHRALRDRYPEVRIAAAQALCKIGHEDAALPVLASYLTDKRLFLRVAAANVVDRIGPKARPIIRRIKAALKVNCPGLKQGKDFLPWLLEHALRNLDGSFQPSPPRRQG